MLRPQTEIDKYTQKPNNLVVIVSINNPKCKGKAFQELMQAAVRQEPQTITIFSCDAVNNYNLLCERMRNMLHTMKANGASPNGKSRRHSLPQTSDEEIMALSQKTPQDYTLEIFRRIQVIAAAGSLSASAKEQGDQWFVNHRPFYHGDKAPKSFNKSNIIETRWDTFGDPDFYEIKLNEMMRLYFTDSNFRSAIDRSAEIFLEKKIQDGLKMDKKYSQAELNLIRLTSTLYLITESAKFASSFNNEKNSHFLYPDETPLFDYLFKIYALQMNKSPQWITVNLGEKPLHKKVRLEDAKPDAASSGSDDEPQETLSISGSPTGTPPTPGSPFKKLGARNTEEGVVFKMPVVGPEPMSSSVSSSASNSPLSQSPPRPAAELDHEILQARLLRLQKLRQANAKQLMQLTVVSSETLNQILNGTPATTLARDLDQLEVFAEQVLALQRATLKSLCIESNSAPGQSPSSLAGYDGLGIFGGHRGSPAVVQQATQPINGTTHATSPTTPTH